MTERNLYDDEFERQLKEKVDWHKMYPSDKVWNNVNSSYIQNAEGLLPE
jgi:hypothetical protein